jgi:hypothetical protein
MWFRSKAQLFIIQETVARIIYMVKIIINSQIHQFSFFLKERKYRYYLLRPLLFEDAQKQP